jgi:hypothetical protein
LFELTKVGADNVMKVRKERLTQMSNAYSESKTPELKISLAMTVPNGLHGISYSARTSIDISVPYDMGICVDHLFRIYLKE